MVNPPLKAFGRSLSDFEKSFVDYPAEKQLLDACRSGKDAVIFEQRPTGKTKENTVRASFLRFLALGGDEYAPVHENGVILQGAWVEDELNLESIFLPHSLLLVKCHLNTIILRDSNVHGCVSFHGCSVDGLEANGMVCSGSLFLEGDFVTAVCLSGAQIGGDLDCTGGKFNGMDGDDALLCSSTVIKGDVFLNETTATGTVRLVSTQIGGSLECTGAKFSDHRSGVSALVCDRAVIKGNISFNGNFTAIGEVRMMGVQIDGDLNCIDGKFDGKKNGDALSFDSAVIKGNVFLKNEFAATGTVRLVNAQIGGSLECTGAKFNDPRSGDQHVGALVCDRAVIKGNIYLDGNFTATGGVSLMGTQIGGDLGCGNGKFVSLMAVQINGDLKNGKFDDKNRNVLSCDGAVIKGCVFLRDGFTAIGTVRLQGAKIGGDLVCSNSTFDGVNGWKGFALLAENTTVVGMFFFLNLSVNGCVSFISAKVGSLEDDLKSWPEGGLDLDGFVYGRLSGTAPTDAKIRLKWLNKQSASHAGLAGDDSYFRPQPWRQLQKVLREMGHIEDARQVAIAFEKRLLRANLIGQTPEDWCKPTAWVYRKISRCFHRLFGWLIGYGYRPLGLFFKMLVVWLLCGAFYWYAALYGDNGNGVFAPSNPLVFQNTEYAACIPESCAAKVEKIKLVYATLQELIKPNNPLKFQNTEYAACVPDSDAAMAEKAKPANAVPPPVQGAGNWYLCEKLPQEYTGFSPLAYSLDLILPLVDLQQEHDWAPMIPTPKNTAVGEWSTWSLKHITRFVVWFEILFGWMSSLLLVAVVSGLTKRREE